MEGPNPSSKSSSNRHSSCSRGSDAGLGGSKQGAVGRLVVLVTLSPCASGGSVKHRKGSEQKSTVRIIRLSNVGQEDFYIFSSTKSPGSLLQVALWT